MIDEILEGLLGESLRRVPASDRSRLLARLFFGMLGAGLGLAGAVHFYRRMLDQNVAMSVSMVAMLVFLACFCLFNVALGRTWRWPGAMFALSFIALFVARLLFGR